MERDVRRDPGQWRGCYSFKDIVCDDDLGPSPRRNGGLKMGHTYYYYYELDGSYETHDPSLPSTTHCPYLPGQMVNTLEVPREQVLRKRSASLSSMKITDFKTMNPADKFVTPRPAPRAPDSSAWPRLGSSPQSHSSVSSRSMSPTPSWRRLFRLRSSSRGSERSMSRDLDERSTTPDVHHDDSRSLASSHGTGSRDISPESLRRFLADDVPASLVPGSAGTDERPMLAIPEDIVEENEDDDNFATSAVSESNPFPTSLSPPPFKRSHSDSSMPTVTNASQMTLTQYVAATSDRDARLTPLSRREGSEKPMGQAHAHASTSDAASSVVSMDRSADEDTPSFYDSHDDDDILSSNDGDVGPFQPLQLAGSRQPYLDTTTAPLSTYSLPRPQDATTKVGSQGLAGYAPVGSPQLIARSDTGVPLGNTSLLAAPGDHGIDDFVSEMNWMVDVIRGNPQ